jgi:membrane protease YdiL (CAAX protease family)
LENGHKLGYPALTDLATFVLVLAVGLPSVFIFSKALKLNPQTLIFSKKKKEAVLSFIIFVAVFAGAFGIYGFYDRVWIRATLTADPLYVLRDVIAIAILLLPVVIALRFSKQTFADIALTRRNFRKNLALGTLTSLMLILVLGILSPFLGGGFAGFSGATGYLLLSYVIIGFGEEIVFRGYIQTRLVASSGSAIGIGVSSLCYAAYNFPLGYFCFSGNILLASVYAAWRLSSGLLYGYTFHKSQNLLSSTIVHIFLVWGGLLFGLYL